MRAPDFWRRQGGVGGLLKPFGQIYGAIASWHAGRRPSWRAPVPVICVGNVTAGGAGKTLIAIDLARKLTAMHRAPHVLTRGYGGTAEGPIVFRAAPGEAVTLTGGLDLPADLLQPVTEEGILARLDDSASEHVRMIDLAALGITAPADPCASELTFRGMPMILARWPNAGYARLGGPPEVTNAYGTARPL